MSRPHAPPGSPHAVVIGLDSITGLQTARILLDRGVRVIGLLANTAHFSRRTRACERIIRSELGGTGLIESLRKLAPDLPNRAVLVPCTDLSVLAISEAREELAAWYDVVLPDHDVVVTLMDKARFALHAQANGLAVPMTCVLRSRDDAVDAGRVLAFPAVVKPGLKTKEWQRHSREKAIRVADANELLGVYDRYATWTPVLLVQEWIDGNESELYTCNVYCDRNAVPRVTFLTRKLRQWPPHTGVGCLGEEHRNDEVLDLALHLFESVGYRGLGYVEMKRDARTGRQLIIEVNVGRPTGRSASAELGGVELLYTAYADAAGLPLPHARRQTYGGAKWIYLRHDLQSSVYHLARRDLTVAEWWRSMRGVRSDAVFAPRDPWPFVADLAHAAGLAIRGLLGRPR